VGFSGDQKWDDANIFDISQKPQHAVESGGTPTLIKPLAFSMPTADTTYIQVGNLDFFYFIFNNLI